MEDKFFVVFMYLNGEQAGADSICSIETSLPAAYNTLEEVIVNDKDWGEIVGVPSGDRFHQEEK